MKKQILFVLMITSLFAVENSWGDVSHYNNSHIGERAAGMGGAYGAIADDASGSYYNPAGLALAVDKTLSANVNAYSVTTKTFKNVFGDEDYVLTSSAYVGNFIGYVQTLGPGKVGLSLAIPDSELIRQDDEILNFTTPLGTNISRYKLNMSINDNTYLFGPSYGYEINDKIAIGTTIYGHYRTYEQNQSELIFFTDDSKYEITNKHNTILEMGLRPMLGIILSPLDKLSFGLTYAKTFITSTTINTQTFFKHRLGLTTWNQVNSRVSYLKEEDLTSRDTPSEYSLSAAYFPTRELLISTDYTYYSKPADTMISTYNVSLGVEYFVTNSITLRGGLFTNNANTDSDIAEHIDLTGVSFSVTRNSRTSTMSFGLNYSGGSGQGHKTDPDPEDVDMSAITVFFAGSHSL